MVGAELPCQRVPRHQGALRPFVEILRVEQCIPDGVIARDPVATGQHGPGPQHDRAPGKDQAHDLSCGTR